MRKIVIHRPGSYDRLTIEAHPDLTPGPGEVLIQVEAIGINYADCVTRMGLYASARHSIGFPITPGFEVAGQVVSTGSRVEDMRIGTPVIGVTLFNGYASQLVVKAEQVFPIPDNMTVTEAAGFPTVFLTAWFALFELAHPHPGATLLVHSAAGGVGSALVQLGKLAGCRVIGVVGGAHKVDWVRELDAEAVIDKSRSKLWSEAEHLVPAGYDVVLDANGVETLKQSYDHLAPVGKLVIYGFHTMLPKQGGRPNWLKLGWDYLRTPRFNPLRLTMENRSVLGFNLSFLSERSDLLKPAMEKLLRWVKEEKIRPHKTTVYAFDRVADAHRDLESGKTIGKLVLRMD